MNAEQLRRRFVTTAKKTSLAAGVSTHLLIALKAELAATLVGVGHARPGLFIDPAARAVPEYDNK